MPDADAEEGKANTGMSCELLCRGKGRSERVAVAFR